MPINRSLRNLCIVAVASAGGGWLALALFHLADGNGPVANSPAALLWLAAPAGAGLLLRAFGGDGWKDAGFQLRLRATWPAYVLALFSYPIIFGALLLGGIALGLLDPVVFSERGLWLFLQSCAAMFLAVSFKNLFEEFAWRGYFTPRLQAAGAPTWLNHLLTALIWMSWHLPYYYEILDRDQMAAVLNTIHLSLPAFLFNGMLVLIPTAAFFGELRLWTGSVWPVFVLHNMVNALSLPFYLDGYLRLLQPMAFLASPTNESALCGAIFAVLAWLIYRRRKARSPTEEAELQA